MRTCAVADRTQFSIGVSFHCLDDECLALLAPSCDPGEEAHVDLPGGSRMLYHSLFREDLMGGNVGGVELRYPPGNEYGLLTGVLYWHGRGFLRNFMGAEFTAVNKQCATFRYKTFPELRNAVILLMRDLYYGTPQSIRAARQVFGLFRIEFNVQALSFDKAYDQLRNFLDTIECRQLLSNFQEHRVQGFQDFVNRHALKVGCV